MAVKVQKKGKKYYVVHSTEGIVSVHNKKSTAEKTAKLIRKNPSQMNQFF